MYRTHCSAIDYYMISADLQHANRISLKRTFSLHPFGVIEEPRNIYLPRYAITDDERILIFVEICNKRAVTQYRVSRTREHNYCTAVRGTRGRSTRTRFTVCTVEDARVYYNSIYMCVCVCGEGENKYNI